MPKVMIITVGTGPTVAHGICRSIEAQNPDKVIFLVTQKSKEKTLHIILQDKVTLGKEYSEVLLDDPNDVEKIAQESEATIRELKCDSKDIVVDFTSGTKAMSAGVTIAGVKLKVGTFVYVTGERDERGVVVSGTERIVSLEPNCIYADDLWRRAIELFNNYQYDASIKIIDEAKSLIAETEFQQKLSTLGILAEAYSCWDRFELKKAFEKLDSLTGSEFLPVWGIKSRIEGNKDILYQEKDNIFCKERLVDLIENAKRRCEEGKFDDTVARLYRITEYIAQYKVDERELYKRNNKGVPQHDDLDIEKLPLDLKPKYEQYQDKKDKKIKLSLHQLYELLKDLKEKVGEIFIKEEDKKDSELKKLLGMRNNSILAHGFNPVGEFEFDKMLGIIQKLAKFVIPDLDYLSEKAKFPKIKI